VPENSRDFMVCPTPLATLPDYQDRRIDHTVFKPPQKRPLTHREQACHGGIRQAISSSKVRSHFVKANHSIRPARRKRFW